MAKIVAVVALLAAAAGGFFGWTKMSDLNRSQTDFANAKQGADTARADLRKATQELAALSKEMAGVKVELDHLKAERDSVRRVLETEQSAGERLRGEVALAKEQVSYLSARSSPGVMQGLPRAPVVKVAPPAATKGR